MTSAEFQTSVITNNTPKRILDALKLMNDWDTKQFDVWTNTTTAFWLFSNAEDHHVQSYESLNLTIVLDQGWSI